MNISTIFVVLIAYSVIALSSPKVVFMRKLKRLVSNSDYRKIVEERCKLMKLGRTKHTDAPRLYAFLTCDGYKFDQNIIFRVAICDRNCKELKDLSCSKVITTRKQVPYYQKVNLTTGLSTEPDFTLTLPVMCDCGVHC